MVMGFKVLLHGVQVRYSHLYKYFKFLYSVIILFKKMKDKNSTYLHTWSIMIQ